MHPLTWTVASWLRSSRKFLFYHLVLFFFFSTIFTKWYWIDAVPMRTIFEWYLICYVKSNLHPDTHIHILNKSKMSLSTSKVEKEKGKAEATKIQGIFLRTGHWLNQWDWKKKFFHYAIVSLVTYLLILSMQKWVRTRIRRSTILWYRIDLLATLSVEIAKYIFIYHAVYVSIMYYIKLNYIFFSFFKGVISTFIKSSKKVIKLV